MKSKKRAIISAPKDEGGRGILFVPRLGLWFLSNQ